MGLSFHFSGRFNEEASLQAMIEEVKDIASIYKWPYVVFEDRFPANGISKTSYNQDIYGIWFTPPGCETVSICFLSNGRMSSVTNLHIFGNSKNKDYKQYLYMVSVKTQYAGIEIHKLVIHLFKYLEKKYFRNFTLSDEGKYWETGDEKILEDTFKRYTFLIESFTSSIENYPRDSGETFDAYFERVLKRMQKNFNQ